MSHQRLIYGRRTAHKLRPATKRALDEVLPRLRLEVPEEGQLDVSGLFGERRPLWLEIGFGAGEHLFAQMERHPQAGFIGCEPFVSGVAKLLARHDPDRNDNLRVAVDDARLLLTALPDASIERLFVLFPDPWPKTRHHKRRIVNPATASAFARVLAPGGKLRLASDDPGYVRAMLEAVLPHPELIWQARRPSDWRERPEDWPPTRYEEKARAAGRRPYFLDFLRGRGVTDAAATAKDLDESS
jgi:tRNA (guanine-N7-)-methyltransferase